MGILVDPLLLPGCRLFPHLPPHDLPLGGALLQFEAVKEVPDDRVRNCNDRGKPVVPALCDVASPRKKDEYRFVVVPHPR